jgi:hypothetical protein
MTLLEILIGVIAIAFVVGLFVLARLATRVGRAADDVGLAARRVADITPAARAFMEAGHAELLALRSLTGTLGAIAENARGVSEHASDATSWLKKGMESGIVNRVHAVISGLRVGAGVLGWFRSRNGSRGFESTEVEEFEDMENVRR